MLLVCLEIISGMPGVPAIYVWCAWCHETMPCVSGVSGNYL